MKHNTTFQVEDLHKVVSEVLKKGNLNGELEIHANGVISVFIEWGDWKHEHVCLRCLMKQNGFEEILENVTEEDGGDCYSAIHSFVKIV